MDTQRALIETFKRDLPEIIDGNDPLPNIGKVCCNRCGMTFSGGNPPKVAERSRCGDCGRFMANAEERVGHLVKVWAL